MHQQLSMRYPQTLTVRFLSVDGLNLLTGISLVTFLKIVLDEITLVWQADSAAVELRLPNGLRMDSKDLAGKLYSKVTSVRIPDGSVKMLLSKPSSPSEWHEVAGVTLDAYIDNYSAPLGWQERAQAQAEFLAKQDGHTCRVLFLYMPDQAVPNDTLAPGMLSPTTTRTITNRSFKVEEL
jgi:hypothetical protein